ncbi:MAG TPA: M1 family metallopeptidase [Allosphingosinicella sp.]
MAAAAACLTVPAFAQPGTGVDILSHRLEITPDFQTQALTGRARIRLRVEQDGLREIVFSGNALVIESARLDGLPVAVAARGKDLVFSPAAALRKGRTATLRVSYRGRPARGVNFSNTSVFTSYWACDWMICSLDRPADKAAFELRLTLPAGMKSLSVGTLRSVKAGPAGLEVHVWRETRPYSSYLYGFAAGRFTQVMTRHGGYELAYLGATPVPRDMQALFGTTGAMARFLEDKAGMPLPVKRYTQLLVPGSEAQEAATYSVIGLKQIEPILQDPRNDWVIVHELAHQYWGNLITSRTWDHLWLNEGMAVFMTAAWKEHRFGRAAYDGELDIARARLGRARQAGFDKPLTFAGPYPDIATRRAVQYSKGALFLDHLRTLLGDKAFWAALKRFTRAHAGGVVDSRDFQRSFEESSGRDLTATFNAWVHAGDARDQAGT